MSYACVLMVGVLEESLRTWVTVVWPTIMALRARPRKQTTRCSGVLQRPVPWLVVWGLAQGVGVGEGLLPPPVGW